MRTNTYSLASFSWFVSDCTTHKTSRWRSGAHTRAPTHPRTRKVTVDSRGFDDGAAGARVVCSIVCGLLRHHVSDGRGRSSPGQPLADGRRPPLSHRLWVRLQSSPAWRSNDVSYPLHSCMACTHALLEARRYTSLRAKPLTPGNRLRRTQVHHGARPEADAAADEAVQGDGGGHGRHGLGVLQSLQVVLLRGARATTIQPQLISTKANRSFSKHHTWSRAASPLSAWTEHVLECEQVWTERVCVCVCLWSFCRSTARWTRACA